MKMNQLIFRKRNLALSFSPNFFLLYQRGKNISFLNIIKMHTREMKGIFVSCPDVSLVREAEYKNHFV